MRERKKAKSTSRRPSRKGKNIQSETIGLGTKIANCFKDIGLTEELKIPGREEPAQYRFSYSATLRIFAKSLDLEAISAQLQLQPTHVHRARELDPTSLFKHDMWAFQPNLPKSEPLERHIDAL